MNGEQHKEKKKTMRATRLSEQEKEMTNETPKLLKIDIFSFIYFYPLPVYLSK